MNIVDANENELVMKLRRLDASGVAAVPGFDYDGMLERHERRRVRARRRASIARASAAVLASVRISASVWRLERSDVADTTTAQAHTPSLNQPPAPTATAPERRLVRADTYLALAALEDHIASIDDALSYARLEPGSGLDSADVIRLERTRAELLDSYVRVRYADTLAANF